MEVSDLGVTCVVAYEVVELKLVVVADDRVSLCVNRPYIVPGQSGDDLVLFVGLAQGLSLRLRLGVVGR